MKNFKTWFAFSIIFLFSITLLTKLWLIQIVRGEYFEAIALGQHVSFEERVGERGEIFFSDGTPLAQTHKKYLAYISPKIDEEGLKVLPFLITKEELENGTLKIEINKEEYELLRDLNLSHVNTEMNWGRVYPQESMASHVLGFLNNDRVGQYGIEGEFDIMLQGKEEFLTKVKGPFYHLVSNKRENIKGSNIILTLDYNIQYIAERALQEAAELYNISSGQIIVEDPKTGRILALVVYPAFNPSQYEKESISTFINPAVQSLFEPGSIFKPFTMAVGLEEGLIEPEDTYIDEGSVSLGGVPIYNYNQRVWGEQRMTDVLEESINTGSVYVEQLIGKELFLTYLEKLGFFKKTDIRLPGEVYSKNSLLRRAYERDVASASFGQGIEINPIQMIRAFGTLANNGVMMTPYIIEKMDETLIEPKEIKRVFKKESMDKLDEMLLSVVENGSGRRTQIEGYNIGGKTGTAQIAKPSGGYYEDETIHSFIGYLPVEDPKALIFVRLDRPKDVYMSGHSTAPVFKKIAKYIIDYYEIPPNPQIEE